MPSATVSTAFSSPNSCVVAPSFCTQVEPGLPAFGIVTVQQRSIGAASWLVGTC